MKKIIVSKVEEAYLDTFKVVIIVFLSISLLVSGVTLLKGLLDMNATPKVPSPSKKAPKPSIDINKFLNEFDPNEQAPIEPQYQEHVTQASQKTTLDDMVDKYLANLWIYVEGYQKRCNVSNPLNRNDFMSLFPKHGFKNTFSKYGEDFAESQDKFEKAVLENERIIQICKDKRGEAQVLASSLNWHEKEYRMQLQEAYEFEERELARVKSEEENEYNRVAVKKAQGMLLLTVSLGAFGIFMSLMLLLIFSKIESNLRGVKIIEKE